MTFTIAQAARFLEVPEHAVRSLLADGSIRVVGKGAYGRHLLNEADVRMVARARELGALGRRQRLVLVVGELADEQHALRVAGLTPERADGILDALARHDVDGAPIIVASPEAVNADLALLQPVLGQIHLAVVTHTQTAIPWPLELSAAIIDPYEPRALVRWAWTVLEARIEAGRLKL